MTLITAVRCDGGVVLCADSQETAGYYRVAVDKIKPRDVGHYELVIGGSGSYGDLIDGLSNTIERDVRGWPADVDEEGARLRIEGVLLSYNANQIAHYPEEKDDEGKLISKVLKFVICVKKRNSSDIFLWTAKGTVIEPVAEYVLIGWEEAIYEHEMKRLYSKRLAMPSAVMLSINLMSMAKATSNYVGGETQLITVRDFGMRLAAPNDVSDLEQRIAVFNQAYVELALACPDLSIHADKFRGLLLNFEERVLNLREYYLRSLAQSLVQRIGTGETAIREQLPMNTSIPIGDGLVVHNMPKYVGVSDGIVVSPPSDSETSEDRQSPYTAECQETDRNASDD